MTFKRTILYTQHMNSNAHMVDFAGWEMPIHYGSQLDEHHQVRQHAGMFDVSHMRVLDLRGTQVKAFLQHLLANDIAKLRTSGKALYSCMLNEQGGVIDDLIVYYFEDEYYRIVINAATADSDLSWMQSQISKGHWQVDIQARQDLSLIAVQGPEAINYVKQIFPILNTDLPRPFFAILQQDSMIARTGYTGEDGVEISLPSEQAVNLWQKLEQLGVKPIGLGARDTLRMEAGMNLYGQDMDQQTTPLEAGLSWTVDLKDETRNFIGKEVLLAQTIKYQLLGILLDAPGVLRAHLKIITDKGDGITTSGGFSPTMQKAIGFAKVPIALQENDKVAVQIRNRNVDAHLVKLPFVRNGKILVNG